MGGGAVTLRFPAGCLSRPELFTLRLLPGSDVPSDVALSPRFSLEPHGFVFDSGRAAELTVQLTSAGPLLAADEEGGAAVRRIAMCNGGGGEVCAGGVRG